MKRVWKVKTNLTEEKNRQFAMGMSEQEHNAMAEINIDISVDLMEGDTITSFMVCESASIEKIKGLLSAHGFEAQVEDETDFFTSDGTPVEKITEDQIYEKLGV